MYPSAVVESIENLILELVRQLITGQLDLRISRISRNSTNLSLLHGTNAIVAGPLTTFTYLSARNYGPLAKLFAVLTACHELVLSNRRLSQRQLYYELVEIFTDQRDLNDTLLDASATLNVPRCLMNVGTATRGVVAGNLSIAALEGRSGIDCTCVGTNGWPIPGDIQEILSLRFTSNASYIIIIEKFGIFQRLVEDQLFLRIPSILICGKGFPSVATRAFACRLEQVFRLPVLGIADCNPAGIMVLQTFKAGSIRSSVEGFQFGRFSYVTSKRSNANYN
eukprot:IDg5562t1